MIKKMHYDFKLKFNKIDSQNHKNLLVPEIDWFLNEAYRIFVSTIANPRIKSILGFETNQRSIDDIRPIVVDEDNWIQVTDNTAPLPDDYLHMLNIYAKIENEKCKDVKARVFIQQHDDMFEESPFYKSSFEWREINAVYHSKGLKLFTDNTFNIKSVCYSYIKQTQYFHNAEDFRTGGYKSPTGELLTGYKNCELPISVHGDIVDIAVLLASGALQTANYQQSLAKLNYNQLLT